jgi:hypothetical protein
MITGSASDTKETFNFVIAPFVIKDRGFLLTISYSGDGAKNTTGAGVWPSVERAKEVAEETATKLLHGATVSWNK